MAISTEKTKLMTNTTKQVEITVNGQKLEAVAQLK